MVLVRKRRGGRRHKKLKAIDPFYSGARKLLLDKLVLFLKIISSHLFFVFNVNSRKLVGANQVPKKDEKVSHRFQEFLDNKQQAQEYSKKKNKNKFKQTTNEEPENPELEQKTNESDRNYIQRLDQVKKNTKQKNFI